MSPQAAAVAALPTSFRKIFMELARDRGAPAGDPTERYILVAPLDEDGRINAELWREHRAACRVVRDHDGEKVIGHLVHGPGRRWSFHYDVAGEAADETGYRLADEHFVAGEYIAIEREDGVHPYRVTAVTPV